MKKLIFLVSLLHTIALLNAQKKPIDFSVHDKWPQAKDIRISNDGKYILYNVTGLSSSLMIQKTDNSWKKEIPNGNNAIINGDNRHIILKISKDSLEILDLEKDAISIIKNVVSYKAPKERNDQWMAYLLADEQKTLVLKNLLTGEEKKYSRIKDYNFSDNGTVLLLQTSVKKDSGDFYNLIWIDLINLKSNVIWQSSYSANNFCFDNEANQLVFITKQIKANNDDYCLGYYNKLMDSATIKVKSDSPGLEDRLSVSDKYGYQGLTNLPVFSGDGKKIYFSLRNMLKEKEPSKSNDQMADVDIWNYKDRYLQSVQLIDQKFNLNDNFIGEVSADNNKITVLSQKDDNTIQFQNGSDYKFLLAISRGNQFEETNPNLSLSPSLYLISVGDGSRKLIADKIIDGQYARFSSNGKYIIWFDRSKRNYFTYNINAGITRNITATIPVPLYDDEDDHPFSRSSFCISPCAWLKKDSVVLIYDRYDIWEVDPDGIRMPVSLTNGFGRRNKTVFRYINKDYVLRDTPLMQIGERLLLAGFNRINKQNGFYSIEAGEPNNPKLLVTGPYIFYLPQLTFSSEVYFFRSVPIKAKNEGMYIVQRMGANEYPNLYSTRDFKQFIPLTQDSPQKNYNWLTSELVHWKMPDGKQGEGILYKPEDFDASKKYPVIFYYYEKLSDGVNQFIKPELSAGRLPIAYFISNGYLVFEPDISYKIGYPGQSAFNSIVSAAKYLSRFPWVDYKHMGLQGHSFGGYETNYIISKTNLFAAAAAAAGPTDLISLYGSIRYTQGTSNESFFEQHQIRIGATPWQRYDLYNINSPINYADKVLTPLLIMHNKDDAAVPWSQGLEWFMALRRLGKKVWMLQYDHEGHTMGYEKNEMDYSKRLAQFFDHFLKGKPMPKWMSEGIPASRKGVDLGFELSNLNHIQN